MPCLVVVGIRQAIAAGEVTRAKLWVTSKIGFYPADADGTNTWVPIAWHANNCKGKETTLKAVDDCLDLLGLEYVDLMLIHNPAAELTEYRASGAPHFFDLFHSPNDPTQPDWTEAERTTFLEGRKQLAWAAKADGGGATERQGRADTWAALEEAHAAGKCRYIGVSNYSPALLREMEGYSSRCMPCVNQLELHPRFSSPALRAYAQQTGIVLTGYGSGNSVRTLACLPACLPACLRALRGSRLSVRAPTALSCCCRRSCAAIVPTDSL
jgi:diketogulonate reductase-like aldo/keto reductase